MNLEFLSEAFLISRLSWLIIVLDALTTKKIPIRFENGKKTVGLETFPGTKLRIPPPSARIAERPEQQLKSSLRATGAAVKNFEEAGPKLMLIHPRQPFDFNRTLKFILSPPAALNGRIFDPIMDHFEEGEYRRVVRIGGHPVLYGVSENHGSSPPALRVRVLKGPRAKGVHRRVQQVTAQQFTTQLDLAPFYRMTSSDKVLAKLISRFRGMRIPQSPTVYECVVCAILEQQVNLTFAHQVKNALVKTYGERVDFEGQQYNVFPEPHVLARTSTADFLKIQVSGPKARYIIGISRAVADGKVDLEALRSAPSAEAYARLVEHKGVGPWTAEYVCLRALGKLDHLPSADVGLQKAVQFFYRLRKMPTPARVEQLGKKWAGWRSYATFYLWLTYWEQADWKKSLLTEIYSGRRTGSR